MKRSKTILFCCILSLTSIWACCAPKTPIAADASADAGAVAYTQADAAQPKEGGVK